jgi:hypothetical protein
MSYVLPLDGCEPHLAEVVGGKAVGLGSLLRQELARFQDDEMWVPAGSNLRCRAEWIVAKTRGLASPTPR